MLQLTLQDFARSAILVLRPLTGRRARRQVAPPVREQMSRPPRAVILPPPRKDHWSMITSHLSTTLARAATARDLQAKASAHLDAADYALQQMLADIAMILPRPSRPSADIVRLGLHARAQRPASLAA